MLPVQQSFLDSTSKNEIGQADRLQDKVSIDYLYDSYAPALYGTLLSWVEKEAIAQLILEQTFESYMTEHLPSECKHERPFICMLRIARKKYSTYLTNR